MFNIVDKKRTGMVSVAEFIELIRSMGLTKNHEDIDAMKLEIDLNGQSITYLWTKRLITFRIRRLDCDVIHIQAGRYRADK